MRRLVAFGLLLLPGVAGADEIYLKSGGHLSGVVLEERDGVLVVEVAPGRISVPRSHVQRVVSSTSPIAVYRDRAAALASGDVRGWLELAIWAQEHELTTAARQAFGRVLAQDPDNAIAQRALGRVLVGDRWLTAEESYRARGFVFFEGSWLMPEERQSILAERAAHADALRARQEAEARVREAEARARTAEAEARRAEATARAEQVQAQQTAWSGIPYPWVFPGSGPIFTAVPFTTLGAFPPGLIAAPGIVSPFGVPFRHRSVSRFVVNVNTPHCTNPAPVVPVVRRGAVAAVRPR